MEIENHIISESAQCYRRFNLRHLKRGIFLKILKILGNFEPKNDNYGLFLQESIQKYIELVVWLQKNIIIRRKFKDQYSSLVQQIDHPTALWSDEFSRGVHYRSLHLRTFKFSLSLCEHTFILRIIIISHCHSNFEIYIQQRFPRLTGTEKQKSTFI